ncbi:hypothetical protein X777_16235 [Ooceraea biroi]|uniref:GIY-YIG domain-containing protein n=1 Tax=Ooceraea biroi TaxID=2015173 RepID=A0A026WX83_OOCBI|nr:hypothetical protein X777_16235 [Ooceraea biroi]
MILDCIIKSGKDALPDSNKTGVVYRLKCKDCDACYVGQTKRHLATRVKEHRSDISKREGYNIQGVILILINFKLVIKNILYHSFHLNKEKILKRPELRPAHPHSLRKPSLNLLDIRLYRIGLIAEFRYNMSLQKYSRL